MKTIKINPNSKYSSINIFILSKVIISLFLLIFTSASINAQSFIWAKNIKASTNNETTYGVSTDSYGNVYYTGKFEGTAIFPGGGILSSSGQSDVFVSKMSPGGTTLWYKKAGGTSNDEGNSIAVDNSGNVYVTGTYAGTATFGTQNITTAGGSDIFLAKYNNSGNLLWVVSAGGNDSDRSKSLALDASGNPYITGFYLNQATFGAHTVNCTGYGVYIAKYNSSGTAQWVRTSTGSANVAGYGITVSGNNVYTAGTFSNTITFNGVTLASDTPRPPIQGFLVAYNTSGTIQWGKTQNSGLGQSWFYGVASDPSGNVYVTGKFDSNILFETLPVTTNGLMDAIFLKYNSAGNVQWVKNGGAATAHDGAYAIAYNNNIVYSAGNFSSVANFGAFSVVPNGGGSDIFLTQLSASTGAFLYTISDGGFTSADYPYSIAVKSQNLFLGGSSGPASYGFDTVITQSQGMDAFVSKISVNQNNRAILGMVYRDLNNNNIRESNEPPVPGHIVNAVNGSFVSNYATNAGGIYYMQLLPNANNYSLTLPYPLLYSTHTPVNPQILISNSTSFVLQDFAYHIIPNMQDLQVTVTPIPNFPRPGFNYDYQIVYKNVGTTVVSSGIQMDFDLTKMTYVSSTGSGIYTAGNNFVNWSFSSLQPGETRTISIVFNILTSAPLGTYTTTSTVINPVAGDQTPYNNVSTTSDRIRGSYDPNDKHCSHDTIITPVEIARQDSLVYTIRFQNTGTADAINVYVTDTISPKLEVSSIEVLAVSHAMELRLEENNIVTFAFDNIMLPDSNTSEPLSHGFIKYKVKPKNNLALGDVITNTAYIFFDFNAPVITNTTYNVVNNIVGINPSGSVIPERFALYQNYPNPFNPATTIKFDIPKTGLGGQHVKLVTYDLLGRIVNTLVDAELKPGSYEVKLDASGLSSGIYFYRIETAGWSDIKKLVLLK